MQGAILVKGALCSALKANLGQVWLAARINNSRVTGDLYKALQLAKELISYEAELLGSVAYQRSTIVAALKPQGANINDAIALECEARGTRLSRNK